MSMTPKDFSKRIQVLVSRGYQHETASYLADCIGDIIETDAQGKWVVRDEEGTILATVDPC